jgi:hypothetical protein
VRPRSWAGATLTLLDAGDRAVLAHRCDWEGASVLAVHNLADEPRAIEIDVGCDPESTLVDLLDDAAAAGSTDLSGHHLALTLDAYGHRWFRVQAPGARDVP